MHGCLCQRLLPLPFVLLPFAPGAGTTFQADPSNIGLHEGLAALCVDDGRPEEAAACYRRCLELLHAAKAAAAAVATNLDASSDFSTAEASARTDRWSVALFKCNASLCQWGDWDAEALALRTAVRRRPRRRRRRLGESGEEGKFSDRREGYAVGGGRVGDYDYLLLGHNDDDDDDDSWPSRDTKQQQHRGGGGGGGNSDADVDGGVSSDLPRPALHPFDSLSAPLSIGDCLAVAQHQSRGLLAEAREEGVLCGNPQGGREEEGVEGNGGAEEQAWPRERRRAASPPSRGATGRVRLGYVSGDLMGTHPLTHLMQASEREQKRGANQTRTMIPR